MPSREGEAVGLVGPNAVLQLMAAFRAAGLGRFVAPLLAAAGVPEWLERPPGEMVDERAVARLHQAVRAGFVEAEWGPLLEEAGVRTADYLLAVRIPWLVQVVLKCLPGWVAARVLMAAIRRNAWTFAGSGRFSARVGRSVQIRIEGNPFCVGERAEGPVCRWHRAVFQRLFRVLVSRDAWVEEVECEASGGGACCFEVRWTK